LSDVAVVSKAVPENPEERARLKIEILEELHGSPIELHLLTSKEWSFIEKQRAKNPLFKAGIQPDTPKGC